jgi:membrane protease subunit HflC
MQNLKYTAIWLIMGIGLIVAWMSCYTIYETEQVIITEFGKPIGDPISEAGLHFKNPFTHVVNRLEKRMLEWDGDSNDMPTKDKTYISVDTFARWVISDSKTFFLRLRNERQAQSRLEDILGSETRNAIAKRELIEVVRTDVNRKIKQDSTEASVGRLYPIKFGHSVIESEVLKAAKKKLKDFGITLLDVGFKRINYNITVQNRIYERMISERKQIADRFRSEGAGEAARIRGTKERDLQKIASEAYRKIQEVLGQADAQAADIYAQSYNKTAQSVEFYQFVKALETYNKILTPDTRLVLSTQNELFQYLNQTSPNSIPSVQR